MDRIPELHSERLSFRKHAEADLDTAAAMWCDPQVVRHIGGRPFTREQVWHRILRYLGHWSLRPFGYWAIHERDGDRFIGEIGLADWKREGDPLHVPEAGWVLSPEVHGRGFAKEALATMLGWADENSIGATCCIIRSENLASIRLAELYGFVPTVSANESVMTYHRPAGP